MAITVKAFRRLMTQKVVVSSKSTYNSYGEATYGAGTTYRAAVVGDMTRVIDATGQEVPTRMTCYLMTHASIRPEDNVQLSTGDVGSTESWATNPTIVSVGRYPFTNGQFCTVIYLK